MNRVYWLLIFFTVLAWSAYHPADSYTWWLEVIPALVAVVILILTYPRFPLTPLLYQLILLHCIVLMIGGHYTYAEVPLFNWMQEWFDWSRNHYDKVGHFVQGFVPAMIARELMIRLQITCPTKTYWRNFLIVTVCLAISAFYELIEWWVALLSDQAAEAFLGTQGYVWDTQSDMGFALMGAISALILLGRVHDKQLKALK